MDRRLSGGMMVANVRGRYTGFARTSAQLVFAATSRSAQSDRTAGKIRSRHLWAHVLGDEIEAKRIDAPRHCAEVVPLGR